MVKRERTMVGVALLRNEIVQTLYVLEMQATIAVMARFSRLIRTIEVVP